MAEHDREARAIRAPDAERSANTDQYSNLAVVSVSKQRYQVRRQQCTLCVYGSEIKTTEYKTESLSSSGKGAVISQSGSSAK